MSSAICRTQYLNKYQKQILNWLQEFPDMTAAQVCDWLKEQYREGVSERTVSRYVKQLREEYGLKKSDPPREYEAVPELSMGQQMQVDLGQKMMPNVEGGQTKVAAKRRKGQRPLYGAQRCKRPRHSDVGAASHTRPQAGVSERNRHEVAALNAEMSARIHGRRPCIEVRPSGPSTVSVPDNFSAFVPLVRGWPALGGLTARRRSR